MAKAQNNDKHPYAPEGQEAQPMGQQAPEEPQRITEQQRVSDRKKLVVKTLTEKFNEDIWRERLLKICGGDESRIMKSLNSFVTYIMNDEGGGENKNRKVFICDCSLSSICAAFLEAFQMAIEVGGGRDHAYLINYAGNCELDISYKGFVYALGKHFDNPFVVAECVFKGDKLISSMEGEQATFKYTPGEDSAFPTKWDDLLGCFCFFSYTQRGNGQKVSRLVRVQRIGDDGLEMARSKAKGSFAWKDFPFEMAKKTTLRRAAKIPFAQIDFGDEEISPETVDNKQYTFEHSSSDKLKLLMQAQEEMQADEKKPVLDATAAMGDTSKPDAGAPAADQASNQQKPEGGVASQASTEPSAAATTTSNEDLRQISKDAPEANNAAQVTDAAFEEVSDAPDWNGTTIYTGSGKSVSKDFADASAALEYLKVIIGHRKSKASRKDIINGNTPLIASLIKSGKGSAVSELHKLADAGV